MSWIIASVSEVCTHWPLPDKGQHTDEILAAHGYSKADIAGFRERKVI
jgi:crotonobetainyl-CoA:carnitine CoA-transferase CaiB-like acyl-CoA transferase